MRSHPFHRLTRTELKRTRVHTWIDNRADIVVDKVIIRDLDDDSLLHRDGRNGGDGSRGHVVLLIGSNNGLSISGGSGSGDGACQCQRLVGLHSLLLEHPLFTVARQCHQEGGSFGQELDEALKVRLDDKVAESQRDLGLVVLIPVHVGGHGQAPGLFSVALEKELLNNQIRPTLAERPRLDRIGDIGGVEEAVAEGLAEFGSQIRRGA